MTEKAVFDFFITYKTEDESWADWVAFVLEEEGYRTYLQSWDFRPGHSFMVRMQEGITGAKRFIALLSSRYLEADFTTAEWTAVFAKDPTGDKGLLIPIRLASDLPDLGLLATRIWIDFVGKDENEAKEALLSGVKPGRAKPSLPPAFPGESAQQAPRFPAGQKIVRIGRPRLGAFIGRDAVIERIDTELSGPNPRMVLFHGLGGVGKSQLAAEYAHSRTEHYSAVWWIDASSPASLAEGLSALAEDLSLPPSPEGEGIPVEHAALRNWLAEHDTYLIVFDDVESVESIVEWLPDSLGGRVLMTSRNPDGDPLILPIEIEPLPDPQGAQYLLDRTGSLDRDAGLALSRLLGGLPLALESAAAYITATKTPLRDYLDDLTAPPASQSQAEGPRALPYRAVENVLSGSIASVTEESPTAIELMERLSLLASDDLPRALLVDLWPEGGPTISEVDDALRLLGRFSLVQVRPSMVRVHPVVGRIVQGRIGSSRLDSYRRELGAVLVALTPSSLEPDKDSGVSPAALQSLAQHALVVGAGLAAFAEERDHASVLLARVGELLAATGASALAGQIGSQVEALSAATPRWREPWHEAEVLYHLGDMYLQGGPDKAAFFLSAAMKSATKQSEGPDRRVTRIARRYAVALREAGDFEKALEVARWALEQDVELDGGIESPAAAAALAVVGSILMNRARADLFESMQVLTMAEAVQGQLELAEDRIQTLSNLGTALRYLGDVKAAEHMHRRALELGEKLFPPDHPSLARDLNGLAGDLRVRERLDEGREALVKARGIYERNYGPRHALVGRIASNLALFERLGGDEAAAQELFQEAYRIVSEALGDDHLFTREVRMMARLRPSAAGGGQEKDAASS